MDKITSTVLANNQTPLVAGDNILRADNSDGSSSPSLVKTVFATTAMAESEIQREPSKPPLNLLTTTPYNMTRMVMRLGPVVSAKESLMDLLAWKKPVNTLIAMLIYCLICFYPILFLMVPQFLVIMYVIPGAVAHNERPRPVQQNPPAPPAPGPAAQPHQPPQAQQPQQQQPATPNNPPGAVPTGEVPLADSFQQHEYLKNLQFLQNFMGIYCELFDQAVAIYKLMDWSDPRASKAILRGVIVALPVSLFAYYFVPLNFLAAVGGCYVFLKPTTFWKTLTVTLPLLVMYKFHVYASRFVASIPIPDSVVDLKPTPESEAVASNNQQGASSSSNSASPGISLAPEYRDAEVFENQRWWAGPGWSGHLLQGERPSWCDGSFAPVPKPQPGTPPPLAGYVWAEDSWTLDFEWANTDLQGWVYSDHSWLQEMNAPGLASLTRRRRWVRRMMKSPTAASPAATKVGSNVSNGTTSSGSRTPLSKGEDVKGKKKAE